MHICIYTYCLFLYLLSRPASPMHRLAILLPQGSYPAGDNGTLRAKRRPRSAHPLEHDRERGAVKRKRCSSLDGD